MIHLEDTKMIFVLTEWDAKGWGEKKLITNSKAEAMRERECKLTADAAEKKYGRGYFHSSRSVESSTIDGYKSKQAMIDGDVASSKNWY